MANARFDVSGKFRPFTLASTSWPLSLYPVVLVTLVTAIVAVMADKITRIAIVDSNKCKPKRCAQECKKVRS